MPRCAYIMLSPTLFNFAYAAYARCHLYICILYLCNPITYHDRQTGQKEVMTSEGLEPPASGFGILRASNCANRPDSLVHILYD
jgi:hypothetical protein